MLIQTHRDLEVYRRAFDAAMEIFELSKRFPREETYSLTDQIRRASRSVNANLAEAWRKRRYQAAFISKLSDADTEAAETQTWIDFAVACIYLELEVGERLKDEYEQLIRMIVSMANHSDKWIIKRER